MTMRRFLRGRDLDVEKASSMFLKYLKWRRSFVPNGFISPSELTHEIQQNKMFLQGSDKKGRPISVLLAARHFQHNGGLDEFKRTPFSLFRVFLDVIILILICFLLTYRFYSLHFRQNIGQVIFLFALPHIGGIRLKHNISGRFLNQIDSEIEYIISLLVSSDRLNY